MAVCDDRPENLSGCMAAKPGYGNVRPIGILRRDAVTLSGDELWA